MKKKILSLALAAMMVMGMTTAVSAYNEDSSEPTYTDVSSVEIKKTYKLVGEGTSPEEEFELVAGAGTVTDGDADSAPALGTISNPTFTAGDATAAGTTKAFTVNLPEYDKVGVYEYTLTEKDGKTAGVTYRTSPIKLVVTVVEEGGKKRVAAVHTEAEGGEKSDTFDDNTYTANTLNVAKVVTGNLGDKSKEFNFTVTFTAPEGKTWNNAIEVSGGASGLTWESDATVAKFTLSDGDTAIFKNVPAGVSYEVVEDNYSSEDYVTTKTNESGTMGAEEITSTFTNNKEKTVDTGISLDNLPYIMILVVLAAAALALVVSRKRRFE